MYLNSISCNSSDLRCSSSQFSSISLTKSKVFLSFLQLFTCFLFHGQNKISKRTSGYVMFFGTQQRNKVTWGQSCSNWEKTKCFGNEFLYHHNLLITSLLLNNASLSLKVLFIGPDSSGFYSLASSLRTNRFCYIGNFFLSV